jgi:hypothetical protein
MTSEELVEILKEHPGLEVVVQCDDGPYREITGLGDPMRKWGYVVLVAP